MFGVTSTPEFNYVTGNVLTTRPTAGFGTQITPGNNTYGTYAEIVSAASVARDCYGILININSIGVSTAATDSLCSIGIDTTGGTAYVDLINGLLCSAAALYVTGAACGNGHWYYFPLFIPSGSSIAAKGSINRATVGTQRIAVWLFGSPTDPSMVKAGSGVESIGVTVGTSTGTAVTSGSAAEGTWTSLGTTTKSCFHWNIGMGVNNAATAALFYSTDLSYGDGTNNKLIIPDKSYQTTAGELLGNFGNMSMYATVPVGATIYGRAQCSGTPDSGLSLAAYGVY